MSDVTITEFLLARWDDLEAEARRNDDPNFYPEGWHPDHVDYVLADIEAKRGIVEMLAPYDDMQVRRQTRTIAGDTLRLLALPFADHPDYRDEWRTA